jgi:hypothetical protein
MQYSLNVSWLEYTAYNLYWDTIFDSLHRKETPDIMYAMNQKPGHDLSVPLQKDFIPEL